MRKIVVLGAGGYARQVVWALERAGDSSIVGMVDETLSHPKVTDGISIFRSVPEIEDAIGHNEFELICGVGSQDIRARWVDDHSDSHVFTSVIDPSAMISPDATVGTNVVILGNSVCSILSTIEDHANINWFCLISHHVHVGAYTNISSGVKLTGRVKVGRNCDIGTNATVIPKCRIGDNVVVGAGAVVTRDLPDNVTAVGVPARIVKSR